METISNRNLVSIFSVDLVNFVLNDHGLPLLPPVKYSENATNTPFDTNIGKVVVALIKGELRDELCEIVPGTLMLLKSYKDLESFLWHFANLFFTKFPCNCLNLFKMFSYITMFSIYFYMLKQEDAPSYAAGAILSMLRTLLDGQFVQEGGLSMLSKYATNLVENDEHLLKMYEHGIYPW